MSTASATPETPSASAAHESLKHFLTPEACSKPGNSFARKVAALRRAFVDAIKPEDLAAIARTLIEKARGGDVAAARFLASYSIGKPAQSPDPDRLDAQEWKNFNETAGMMKELPQVGMAPDPKLPLHHVRSNRAVLAYAWGRRMIDMWQQSLAAGKVPECQTATKEDKPPSTNRDNGGLGEPWPPLDPDVWAALAELNLPPPDAAR